MSKRSGVVPVEYTIAIPVILVTGAAVIASLLGHRDTISGQTYCMTQLNALNKSTLVYCEMSRGFLMPYTHAPVAGTELTEAAPSADHTAVCFAAGPVNPATGCWRIAATPGTSTWPASSARRSSSTAPSRSIPPTS